MQKKQFKCEIHPQLQIQFFCTANQWHFIPLCKQCIPNHTQNHQKNFKIVLQSFHKILEKINVQRSSAIKQYQNRLKKISIYQQTINKIQIFDTLQNIQNKLINAITNYFASIKKQFQQRINDTIKYQKQLLEKLKNNIEADIKDFQNIELIKSVQHWAEVTKKLYFKNGIMPYLDQIDQVLKDHQDRIFKRNDFGLSSLENIQKDINQVLATHVGLKKVGQSGEEKGKIAKENAKDNVKEKKKIPKQKSNICKSCGTEMQYLTQLKKHLFCPNCGGKERNYCPKKS